MTAERDFGPAEAAVMRLAEGSGEPDFDRQARFEAALAVARQLDTNSQKASGSAGLAVASLAREFRAVLDELRSEREDKTWNDLVARLVSDDD